MNLTLDSAAKYWHRLWSVRFAVLAALVSIAGELLPLWEPVLAPFPYAAMSTLFAALAAVSRVVHQGTVQSDLEADRSNREAMVALEILGQDAAPRSQAASTPAKRSKRRRRRYPPIVAANPHVPITAALPAGLKLSIPMLEPAPSAEELPPWMR